MDTHNMHRWIVRIVIDQNGLNVYPTFTHKDSKIIMKIAIIPFRSLFTNLIDKTAGFNMLMHDFGQSLESTSAELVCQPMKSWLFCGDVICNIPVTQDFTNVGQDLRIGQGRHRLIFPALQSEFSVLTKDCNRIDWFKPTLRAGIIADDV